MRTDTRVVPGHDHVNASALAGESGDEDDDDKSNTLDCERAINDDIYARDNPQTCEQHEITLLLARGLQHLIDIDEDCYR